MHTSVIAIDQATHLLHSPSSQVVSSRIKKWIHPTSPPPLLMKNTEGASELNTVLPHQTSVTSWCVICKQVVPVSCPQTGFHFIKLKNSMAI